MFFCLQIIYAFFSFNDLYCHWFSQHQMTISLSIWSFKLSLVNYCLVFRLSTNESLWSLFWQLNFYENGRLTTQGGLKLFLASTNNCKRHIFWISLHSLTRQHSLHTKHQSMCIKFLLTKWTRLALWLIFIGYRNTKKIILLRNTVTIGLSLSRLSILHNLYDNGFAHNDIRHRHLHGHRNMVRRRRIIRRRRRLAFPIVLHARQHRRHAGHARGSRLAATGRRCGRFDDVDGGRSRQAAARRSIRRWDAAADRWTGGSGGGAAGSDVGEVADTLVG